MLVKYETPSLVDEIGIGLTKPGDAKHASLSTFELYNSKHEDSMEIQMVKLVHASAKKVRDVKHFYGRKI
jgi:hypothetical protein